jgi:hypothetical protein
VDEYFADLLSRPQRLERSTLRAYQWRLKGFSEYVCDRRYPWTVICEREFGRAPGQLFDERNLVAHLDEFEGDPHRRPRHPPSPRRTMVRAAGATDSGYVELRLGASMTGALAALTVAPSVLRAASARNGHRRSTAP